MIRQIATSRESFQSAESGIADVDVAQESAELMRLNVLQQAGTAILAQANMQPQLALKLLNDS
jgi:flagellin